MKSSVKAVVVVVLVTELSFYVSRQYVCDDVACMCQHCPLCSSCNRTETPHCGGITESDIPLFATVCPLFSTSVCVDIYPCSPDSRSLQLDYWLCSWSDVTFPLPILLLVIDIVMCCWDSCALANVVQLLLSLIVPITNARLQAMLLKWVTLYSDTVPPFILPPPDLYLPLLTINLLFRLLHWKSHCSYTDTDIHGSRTSIHSSSSDICASVTQRLEQLRIGPTHLSIGPTQPFSESSSWLRRLEQLELFSFPSSPSHTVHFDPQPQPSSISSLTSLTSSPVSGSQALLWPARLQPPRANFISATASLSLTD